MQKHRKNINNSLKNSLKSNVPEHLPHQREHYQNPRKSLPPLSKTQFPPFSTVTTIPT